MAVSNQSTQYAYGPRVDRSSIPNLYPPQTLKPYTPPPTGIDNLGIKSTDTFVIVGVGEVVVNFKGFVRVARSEPTSTDWNTSCVYTNMFEMCMRGQSEEIGEVIVTLNPDFLSTGQLNTPFGDEELENPSKACRMAVGAFFSVPRLGKVLFNKEPLILTIDEVKTIPPAGNPGAGLIHRMLPLFDRDDPEGTAVAYLTALKFAMGTYITEAEIQAIKDGYHPA